MVTIEPLYWLTTYHAPAIFIGAFLFGETVIISASFLAAHGWWSAWTVFWLALIGTVIADCIWFWLGNIVIRTKRWQRNRDRYQHVIAYISKKTGDRPYLALIPIKFLYGTRILTIVYLSLHKTNFWFFVLWDTIATTLLLAVIIPIGWFAGKGYGSLVSTYHNVTYAVAGILGVIIFIKLVTIWLGRRVIGKG